MLSLSNSVFQYRDSTHSESVEEEVFVLDPTIQEILCLPSIHDR
jgi:hypothetical protein